MGRLARLGTMYGKDVQARDKVWGGWLGWGLCMARLAMLGTMYGEVGQARE